MVIAGRRRRGAGGVELWDALRDDLRRVATEDGIEGVWRKAASQVPAAVPARPEGRERPGVQPMGESP
ncbi:hypothetical protein GCM10010309_74970 [Streptomyces violaceochromogenes]|nr:hypothetical protein GCM10010309_74970 [Streptomyces violaceochromogenes]